MISETLVDSLTCCPGRVCSAVYTLDLPRRGGGTLISYLVSLVQRLGLMSYPTTEWQNGGQVDACERRLSWGRHTVSPRT